MESRSRLTSELFLAFALRIESIDPKIDELVPGAVVICGFHSPAFFSKERANKRPNGRRSSPTSLDSLIKAGVSARLGDYCPIIANPECAGLNRHVVGGASPLQERK